MKQRTLSFVEGTSKKFWSVETVGNQLRTTFGRIGSTGQTSVKAFATPAAAEAAAEKLLAEKTRKGYIDGEAASTSSKRAKPPTRATAKTPGPSGWTALVEATDRVAALFEHFKYLCDSPGFEPVLKAIVAQVESVAVQKPGLVMKLRGQNDPWIAGPPASNAKLAEFPKSFLALAAHHGTMSFGDRLRFSGSHALDMGTYDEGDCVYEMFGGKGKNARTPVTDFISNDTIWVYSPDDKNRAGEPALFPVVHELEDVIEVIDLNVGALFLSRFAEALELAIDVPDPKPPKTRAAKKGTLDPQWVKIFRVALGDCQRHELDDVPTDAKPVTLARVLEGRIKELDCLGLPISDLAPLAELAATKRFGLERLSLSGTRVRDVSALANLKKLYALDITDTPVTDVSAVTQLKHLTADRCTQLDLGSVAKLRKLTRLSLRETALSALSRFQKLPLTQQLAVWGTRVTDAEALAFKKSRAEMKLDLRPDLKDPERRKLAELADYQPEEALAIGEQLFAKASGKAKDQILDEMVALSDRASSRYLYTDKLRFQAFHAKLNRLRYMQKSRDYAELRSVKGVKPIEIAKLMLDVYKRKKHYSEDHLEARSLFSVELFARHLGCSSFHDITIKDVETAAIQSGKFSHKRDDHGMYIKPK